MHVQTPLLQSLFEFVLSHARFSVVLVQLFPQLSMPVVAQKLLGVQTPFGTQLATQAPDWQVPAALVLVVQELPSVFLVKAWPQLFVVLVAQVVG
jgi:hypothetical protein